MEINLGFLFISTIKIVVVLGYLYALLAVLGHASKWVQIGGLIAAFGLVQLIFSFQPEDAQIINDFDRGLLFQACTMAMVALGLNLIYGFNGQFSLGQWGFYGIGAYAAADITWRWTNNDARGLTGVAIGATLVAVAIFGVRRLIARYKGMPVMSAFTLYLIGTIVACALTMLIAGALDPALKPLFGTKDAPGIFASEWALQIVFFFAVLLAGIVAAEISFLFGLPVLTLGSDYFGIATLGFTIVINTLMVNSDTLLPFPEMKGGRGMIGIPKVTNWFWAFLFLLIVVIVMRNVLHSSTGRAILSVREDETAAKVMGINVADYKLLPFVIGSLFAGLGGGVYAHFIGFLSPGTFDFLVGFNPLIIIVFGGLGSMSGTIFASFGWMFFLEGLLRTILGQFGTEAPTWRFVLYPITLLLLMLLRPQGLLGSAEVGFLRAPKIAARTAASDNPAVTTPVK